MPKLSTSIFTCALIAGWPAVAAAQDAIPSPQVHAAEGSQEARAAHEAHEAEEAEHSYPLHAWELPALQVRGRSASPLREEDRVGSYGQPRWTTNRRFPTTRVYVVPAGKFEFEWWNRWQAPLEHIVGSCTVDEDTGESSCTGRKLKSQYEFELGLGYRLQLDLYLQFVQDGPTSPIQLDEEKFELRYALADWGVIPGNPTLYLEWARHSNDVDFLEGKILLGGEMAVGWHWGLNFIMEAGLGGAGEKEYQIAGGVGHTFIDEVLSIGLEAKFAMANEDGQDFGHGKEFFAGPSFSWSPVPPAHILFTPLIGLENVAGEDGEDSETEARFEGWLIAGWTL